MRTLFDDDAHDDDPGERARVESRIGAAIMDFCQRHNGQRFYADELRRFVRERVGEVAPDSPGRILRDLKRHGRVNYRVVNRRRSLYEILKP